MNTPLSRFPLKSLTLAVIGGLSLQSAVAFAQEADEDKVLEEVVATGTRLKGTATAVLQERKNQAFVADILGAEQISRTGDSDAASALRRVTGLTLVDGKFIYVRGLGERYSSTQLNGAAVPSPDPTRSVIPLDLFPSDIIESLSVQKSFSPSMPAAFGGGNVDIRLKTIPTDFVFNVTGKIGGNSDNFDDAYQYNGGDNDWRGKDDGTRAAPQGIVDLWESKAFLDNVSSTEARDLLKTLNRDYDPKLESVDPDFGMNMTVGNRFDYNDDIRYGFLLSTGYNNTWQVADEFIGEDPQRNGDEISLVRFFDEVQTTEHSVKWSGLANFGIDYKRNHRIDFSTIVLNDTRDQIRDSIGNSNNIQLVDGQRIRDIEVIYEERKMFTNQVKGTHTFTDLNFLGFDWRYSLGRSLRRAPGNFEARFILEDENGDGLFDTENESSLTNATTAARYQFQTLHDRVENYGWNMTYPVTLDKWEIELKTGADFVSKSRTAENRRFDVNTRGFADSSILEGYEVSDILSNDVLDSATLNSTPLLSDTTIAGDDYVAAQKIDGYYIEGDFFFDNTWRFSGGLRWEDFRQAVVPFDPKTNQIDLSDEADRSQLAFNEDDVYLSLAATYTINEEMQLRVSYGETVVRPDLREVSSSTYIDPLTDFPVGGTPGLKTTAIKNYDARWEWYIDNGDNLSVGVFYKDMDAPIESVQSPSQDGPPLVRIANAETGELYGVEVEFLKGLGFIGKTGEDFFLSGNLTLSDSEIVLDRQNIVEQTGVSASITNLERRLTGHSKYVANVQLGFDAPNGNHSASLVYNVFGDRILIPGIDGFDDNYESPFHSLDAVYTYYPDFNSTVKFKVQNLLDESKEIEFENVLFRSETRGISFNLSYKRDF
ncbi:TonB-dependent receptor [Paraglaciecola chathamensis]|uniref:TonB-dependent receptor domain-containing protein n=1 Tax=Paraglaciecola chathamensis TaxID=368405 RepID=UPI0026FB6FA2|nr:TonB-dependent receptor [Paraglaciecola chathamensis]MDO6559167.1 TonB-dependent receptor [Paraglaciecola chathamensis]MDO6838755.1 TonB-dependent receptor [Paraglaciecola chathamensis]